MADEQFRATSGRVSGIISLVVAAVVLAALLVDRDADAPAWVVWLVVTFAVLAWAAMLKPQLRISGDDLVMRNMLETVHIPLATIETVVVRQVFAVLAGERRFVSSAIGSSWRQALKSNKRRDAGGIPETYPEMVEDKVWQAADAARARLGIANTSDEQLELAKQIRREPAWVEIAALAISLCGLVAAIII